MIPLPAVVPSLTGSAPAASEACEETPAVKAWKSSTAYGLAITNAAKRDHEPASEPPRGDPELAAGAVADERGDQAHQGDPAGVLGRRREPDPDAGDHVVAQPAAPHDAGDPVQRQRDRGERRHVVEREVAVEDRQEREAEDRRGEQRRPSG